MFVQRNNEEIQFRLNATAAIKDWVRQKLGLSEDVVVMVTEVACAETNCPDKETVIAVMEKGGTKKFNIRKPLLYVRKWDLDAWKPEGNGESISTS